MRAGFTPDGPAFGVVRRALSRPVSVMMLGSILAGCADTPSAPTKHQLSPRPAPVWAPPFAAAVTFTNIDYSLGVANANSLVFVIQGSLSRPFAFPGGLFQSSLLGTPMFGFPTDRDKYLVASSGDARTVGADMAYGICGPDVIYDVLCDQGGIDVPLYVHPNATRIEVDVRYFTVDYNPFEDPFRIFIVDGGPLQVFEATITSELGVKPDNGQLAFGPLRRVMINATPYRGRVIIIRFLASDRTDVVLASGALIDNLMVR